MVLSVVFLSVVIVIVAGDGVVDMLQGRVGHPGDM